MNANDFSLNRQRLGEQLAVDSLLVLYSGSPVASTGDEHFPFEVYRNFYYLTGIREPKVLLVMKKNVHGEVRSVLYIPAADPVMEKWVGKTISAERAEFLSGISEIRTMDYWWGDLVKERPKLLYCDPHLPLQWQPVVERFLAPLSVDCSRMDLSSMMTDLRNIKQPGEIEEIRQAIAIGAKGIAAVEAALKSGISEGELAEYYRYTTALAGGEGMGFPPIVASGPNGAVLHYSQNRRIIQKNDLVLLDLGVAYHCYNSDISRTLCAGSPTDLQWGIYESVLEVQQQLVPEYRPGIKMKTIQEKTKVLLKEALMDRGLFDETESIDQVYFHGIGHPLGLDVHDLGRQPDLVLAPGMVMTCEPGLYFADLGIGVRIEDDLLITEDEPVNLSQAVPKWMK